MSFNSVNFQNIITEDISSVDKFLKRDFLEIQYLKDPEKIEKFISLTVEKNLERLTKTILKRNPEYGIIHKNHIIKESSIDLFWMFEIIDDYLNFKNSIEYWGIHISVYDRKNKEIVYTHYYMPILNNIYFASKQEGVYLNNKRLDISKVISKNIYSNLSSSFIQDANMVQRNFGSEILSIFFYTSGKINKLYLQNSKINKLLSHFIIKEFKGIVKYLDIDNKSDSTVKLKENKYCNTDNLNGIILVG